MANVSIALINQGPTSTAITLTPATGFVLSGTAPNFTLTSDAGTTIAAGTAVATLAVVPAGWAGQLSLSGANASDFSLNAGTIALETAAAIPNGTTVDVSITSNP